MNTSITTTEVQDYLNENAKQQPSKVALAKSPFADVTSSELAEQIDSKQRLASKLPTWLSTEYIHYPPRRNAEQCSSEATAKYKAKLIEGKRAIDLTGGFGVDVFALSQHFDQVDYCEMDEVLFPIVQHNLKQLDCKNVTCHLGNSIDFLHSDKKEYDLIYLDPARRDEYNRKMVGFADCTPNIIGLQDFLFEKSPIVVVKASPMIDISKGLQELNNVKEVHVVALKNECKELLFVLDKQYEGEASIHTVNIIKDSEQRMSFIKTEEQEASANMGEIGQYIYEPNTAVLKAGAFNILTSKYDVKKLNTSTHIYSSDELIKDFPGKLYKVQHLIEYNKKSVSKVLSSKQINVKTYNFSNTPQQVQKKLGLQDGGSQYLFAVKDIHSKYKIIITDIL